MIGFGLAAHAALHRMDAEDAHDLYAAQQHIDQAEAWETGYSDLLEYR